MRPVPPGDAQQTFLDRCGEALSDGPCRNAHNHLKRRYITCHNGPRTDSRPGSNCYIRAEW